MMSGPKITIIGAGSYFFGRPMIHKMATSPLLAGGTLALVDTDPKVLATMLKLARRVCGHTKCGVKVIGSTKRREVMKDSDFVIITFSRRNAYYRGLDTQIAAAHGIRMASSDTIGPGGIFRSMRELPTVVEMARDAAKLCPQAWVINIVNPTATMGIALQKFVPEVRSFALCDGQHEPHFTRAYLRAVGILPAEKDQPIAIHGWYAHEDATVPAEVARKLDMRVAGVNHCTWMTRFTYDGKDMLPKLRRAVDAWAAYEKTCPYHEDSKVRFNAAYAGKLMDIYGAYPTVTGHTKEYVPFFQGYGKAGVKPEAIRCFDAATRAKSMGEAWRVTQEYAAGKRTVKEFLSQVHNEMTVDIIETMWGGLGKRFFINTPNRGAVTNLSADAFLELKCDLDMQGPRPMAFGAMPTGLRALQQQVLDTHELTAEAAMTGDRALLRRAMLTDPICNNIEDADGCIADVLKMQKEALPRYWFARK